VAAYWAAVQERHAGQEDASVPPEENVPALQGAHRRSCVGEHASRKVPGVVTHVTELLQVVQELVCATRAVDHVPEAHA